MAAYNQATAAEVDPVIKRTATGRKPKSPDDDPGLSFRSIINRNPILSHEEIQELFNMKGTPEWPAAREKLVLSNLRLVVKVASKYVFREICSLDDVVSYGVIGLIKAIDRFDIKAGTRLSTYAVYWIEETICSELIYKKDLIRLPDYVHKLAIKLDKILKASERDTGSKPSMETLAKLMGLPESKVQFIMNLRHRDTFSLDAPVSDDRTDTDTSDLVFGEAIPSEQDVEEEAVKRVSLSDIMSAVKKLEPFEQRVIMLRFGFVGGEPMSLRQCAKELGCSDETVRRTANAAIQKLQHDYLNTRRLNTIH